MKFVYITCLYYSIGLTQASTLIIPNNFTANTPAHAAEVNANFNAAKAAVDDNDSRITGNVSRLDAIDALLVSMQSDISSLQNTVVTQQSTINAQQAEITQLATDLAAVENNSVLSLDGKLQLITFNGYETAEFTGVNVQVNDGTGTTQGTTNGLGNLQIGYNDNTGSAIFFCSDNAYDNEADCNSNGGTWDKNVTTGSHNLIVGDDHSYTSHGAIIAGFANISNDRFSSVLGGWRNLAAGNVSTVTGGSYNVANGSITSVSGGNSNAATGNRSSVSGGENIVASSAYDWQAGGVITQFNNDITSILSNSVLALDGYLKLSTLNGYDTAEFTGVNVQVNDGSGDTEGAVNGLGNVIIGYNERGFDGRGWCSLPYYSSSQTECENNNGTWQTDETTGSHNLIIGQNNSYTSYGGLISGESNVGNDIYASVIGGYKNLATGERTVIVGGELNTTVGDQSTILGGYSNLVHALANRSSISGGGHNIASGQYASVSGGHLNEASGDYSTISGGQDNLSFGIKSSISGGYENFTSGSNSSVSGGRGNSAIGYYSSVSGGRDNSANGFYSNVSGGQGRVAPIIYNWTAGTLTENN